MQIQLDEIRLEPSFLTAGLNGALKMLKKGLMVKENVC